jgi:heme a synthase
MAATDVDRPGSAPPATKSRSFVCWLRSFSEISPERYRRFVLVALFFVSAIILTGAAVRLSGSGLGCPTWPRCTGEQLVDISEPHRAVEQLNRLFTGTIGFACIAVFAASLRRRPYRRDLTRFGALLIAGVFLQAVIGGIVVLLELQWHSVVLHFLASILLLYGNLELLRRSGEASTERNLVVDRDVRLLAEATFALTVLVVALGTLVTSAGPHGGDEDVDRLDWNLTSAVRAHSIAVWCLVAATIALTVLARRRGAAATSARSNALLAVLMFQGAIGYLQWFNRVPPVLVELHILGAVAVFIAASWLRFGSFAATERPDAEATASPAPGA